MSTKVDDVCNRIMERLASRSWAGTVERTDAESVITVRTGQQGRPHIIRVSCADNSVIQVLAARSMHLTTDAATAAAWAVAQISTTKQQHERAEA